MMVAFLDVVNFALALLLLALSVCGVALIAFITWKVLTDKW